MTKKSDNSILIKFLFSLGVLLLCWLIVYEGYLKHLGQPDAFLTYRTAHAGKLLLSIMGYATTATQSAEGVLLSMDEVPLLIIAHNCNGLAVLALFTCFIIIFPGKPLNKLWYIPAGMALLFSVNALRVAFLTIIQIHHSEWLDFNHTYTFTLIIYSVVFLLWVVWIKLYTPPKTQKWHKEKLQPS